MGERLRMRAWMFCAAALAIGAQCHASTGPFYLVDQDPADLVTNGFTDVTGGTPFELEPLVCLGCFSFEQAVFGPGGGF